MKNSKWLALVLAGMVGAGGLAVWTVRAADTSIGAGREVLRGQFLERAKQKLGLTDEQSAEIKAVLKADKEAIGSLLSRLHEARTSLRAAIHSADGSEAAVRAASAKVAAAEADLAVERLKLYGKISPILTAEQQEKLKAFQAKVDAFVDRVLERIHAGLSE